MEDDRPVNLDISSMRLPITAWASISHRVTGVLIVPIFGLFLWMLQASLAGMSSFEELQENLSKPLAKFVLWSILTVYAYHLLAGIKHLLMDFGYGESFEGGVIGVKLLLVATILCSVLIGFWLW